jgi:hypothetical protein
MELYRVVPESHTFIASVANVPLIARGPSTDEKRNNPLVWFSGEGYTVTYYLPPKEAGKLDGQRSGEDSADGSLVVCTFEDAMRDCWERRYKMKVEERVIWDSTALWNELDLLASHLEGRSEFSDEALQKAQRKIASSIEYACIKFRELCQIVRKI